MVLNKFNIVDFGGFDLVNQNGGKVPGIFDKILEANWNCVYIMCFGLKFGDAPIPPFNARVSIADSVISLNNTITVMSDDTVSVEYNAPPVALIPLDVTENGLYLPPAGILGFSEVNVHTQSGDYVRVSVVDEFGDFLYDNYFHVGDAVEIDEFFFYNDEFYSFEFATDSIESSYTVLVTDLNKESTNFTIRQGNGTKSYSKDGNDLIVTFNAGSNYGIVLYGSSACSFMYHDFGYKQAGRCTATATLPTIVTRGAGRTTYITPDNNDVQTTVQPHGSEQYFISGTSLDGSTIRVYNFFN